MDYNKKLEKAKKHALLVKQKQEIYDAKHENDKKKSWSFTKKLMAFLICNCSVIEIYSLIAIWRFGDLSPLSCLITAIVGECVGVIAYSYKSSIENRSGGITYETAMFEMKNKFHKDNDEEPVG